ncbi:hypothetical protein HK104_000644 [Borealophlyctis nickersoniae]|nr:hypothetical protein HK104_000644 [Borealophlyctis nickersoniae]
MPNKKYTSLKVAQLRELCDERGLPSKNLTKKVLIEALEKHDEEHGTASEPASRSASAEPDPVPTPGRTTRSTQDASSNDSTPARAARLTRQGSKALDPVTGDTDNSNGVVEAEEKEQAAEEETEVLPTPAEGSAKTAGSGAVGKGKRKKNATEDAPVVEQEPPAKRTKGLEQDAVDKGVAGESKATDPSNEQSMEVDSEPVGQERQVSQRQEGEESSVDTSLVDGAASASKDAQASFSTLKAGAIFRTQDCLISADVDANATNVIHIRGFTRPLLISAVRELIEQYGEVMTFWMNKIKSHAFVTYASEAQAIAAKTAIQGLKFPAETGKNLDVEFTTKENADQSIAEEETRQQRAAPPLPPAPAPFTPRLNNPIPPAVPLARPIQPVEYQHRAANPEKNFFLTRTKPRVFYGPVAERRDKWRETVRRRHEYEREHYQSRK